MEKTTGEEQSIHTRTQDDAATYLTVACVQEDRFQVACYSPPRIPEGSRRDIAEALVRDFDDGELRFQVAQITEVEAVIDRMIGTARWCTGNEEAGEAIGREDQ